VWPAGRWFSPGTLVSSTNKTDRHDINEILLKVLFKTIAITPYTIDNMATIMIYYLIAIW